MASSTSKISARVLHLAKQFTRRLPPGSRTKRDIVDAALLQLEDIAYWRLRSRGFSPRGIIDVGGHQGDWIRAVRRVFADCPILSIEAREEQREILARVCSELPNVQFKIALLGREPKPSVKFQVHGSGSSLFAERSDAQRSVHMLPMVTLDQVVGSDKRLLAPLFVKLDVQGAELEVLNGADKTLEISEIVQLEVALLDYNEGAPPAAEVIAFMERKGFSIFDVAGFVRPNGSDLAQIDLLFAKTTSPLRQSYFHFEA